MMACSKLASVKWDMGDVFIFCHRFAIGNGGENVIKIIDGVLN